MDPASLLFLKFYATFSSILQHPRRPNIKKILWYERVVRYIPRSLLIERKFKIQMRRRRPILRRRACQRWPIVALNNLRLLVEVFMLKVL